MSSEDLPLPVGIIDYENFVVSDFFNDFANVGHSHAIPKNTNSIIRIQASVEIPFANPSENVTLYVFRSRPSGYTSILQVNLNSVTMPNYRTYFDFTDYMNPITLTDSDRLAVTLVPNGSATGKTNRALTVKIDLNNIENFAEQQVFGLPIDVDSWPQPP
jgi:hypothetical protein